MNPDDPPLTASPATKGRDGIHCHLVGGGVAGLASAVCLIRDGGVPGPNIHLYEAGQPGGSLDAAGSAEQGYSMRGSRMFGPAYVLTYELLDGIPSLDDPAKSITADTFEFWQATPWYDKARLVGRGGQIADLSSWGLRNRDRADLVKLMLQPEGLLDGKRIDQVFEPPFLESNFWLMWCSMFGFETWHSAAELRRYLLRFLRLFPDLETMQIIQSTRYNGHDSIVRPMLRWLQAQGVSVETGVQVTDLHFGPQGGARAVRRLSVQRGTEHAEIHVNPHDPVIVTLGSMTAASTLGSMTQPPAPTPDAPDPAWELWQKLAAKDPAFGHPSVFCGHVGKTRWITFTVTDGDRRFVDHVERLGRCPAGCGGLVTLKDSRWMLTFHLYPSPAFPGQPADRFVWWGYGLYADRPGDFVPKRMIDCSGEEILVELYSHLGLQDQVPALLAGANCIPCLLPYTTSQFMPRHPGDRPQVIPPGTANLAFVGQYCEVPDDVVYTVEYSVHSARIAVNGLLGLDTPLPPTYQGLDHPNALVEALRRILR
ncbi:MAG: oleate hydratase [Burkholderiaceae bacterium]|nr:oleate hydratase [Burkholderiaceae bacterium]